MDGQDFEEVEKYGVLSWLGELALALKTEKYQPEPIRRVFTPKANGKLRPLGISTLGDRGTAAMLVLEPIFEADLPDEQYACRAGRAVMYITGALKIFAKEGAPRRQQIALEIALKGQSGDAAIIGAFSHTLRATSKKCRLVCAIQPTATMSPDLSKAS